MLIKSTKRMELESEKDYACELVARSARKWALSFVVLDSRTEIYGERFWCWIWLL